MNSILKQYNFTQLKPDAIPKALLLILYIRFIVLKVGVMTKTVKKVHRKEIPKYKIKTENKNTSVNISHKEQLSATKMQVTTKTKTKSVFRKKYTITKAEPTKTKNVNVNFLYTISNFLHIFPGHDRFYQRCNLKSRFFQIKDFCNYSPKSQTH